VVDQEFDNILEWINVTIMTDPVKILLKKTKQTISKYRMITPGDKVLMAVSGGPDSVCLLDVLAQLSGLLQIKLVVAHFNHGLRKTEDESETQLVKDLAKSMDLPFYGGTAMFLHEKKGSIEEKAREERYRFLEKIRKEVHAQRVATGHHLNDQAETMLMRLLRGSGPFGLTGIPIMRGETIIRPFMEIKQKEIMNYIRIRELTYATDSSNMDIAFQRNKIRLDLIPKLLQYQPRLIEHLDQLSRILYEDNHYLDFLATQWVQDKSRLDPNGNITITISSFTKLPEPIKARVIRQLLYQTIGSIRGINYQHIVSIADLIKHKKSQAKLDLPKGLVVQRIYDTLLFSLGRMDKASSFDCMMEGPGSCYIDPIKRFITVEEFNGPQGHRLFGQRPLGHISNSSKQTAFLDADTIQYPLQIRNTRPGDRFIPLGMKGRKKIKDFFIDRKVPGFIRTSTPLLLSQGKILWVCGFQIDDGYKITPETSKILKVSIS
jgi:tRNA(Ile)-lysidine synthase